MNKYRAFFKQHDLNEDTSIVQQGFQLRFENGIDVSVAFGDGTFSDKGLKTAEIAVIDDNGNWYEFTDNKLIKHSDAVVNARVTPDDLVTILILAKELQISVYKSNKKQNLKPPPPPPDRIIIEGKIPDPPRNY